MVKSYEIGLFESTTDPDAPLYDSERFRTLTRFTYRGVPCQTIAGSLPMFGPWICGYVAGQIDIMKDEAEQGPVERGQIYFESDVFGNTVLGLHTLYPGEAAPARHDNAWVTAQVLLLVDWLIENEFVDDGQDRSIRYRYVSE